MDEHIAAQGNGDEGCQCDWRQHTPRCFPCCIHHHRRAGKSLEQEYRGNRELRPEQQCERRRHDHGAAEAGDATDDSGQARDRHRDQRGNGDQGFGHEAECAVKAAGGREAGDILIACGIRLRPG